MKVEKTMTIKGKDSADALMQAVDVISNHKGAVWYKVDDVTIVVNYLEEKIEEPTAKVINLTKAAEGPLCKDCPHYNDMNYKGHRGANVLWGKCELLQYAAVHGSRPICSIRIDEIGEMRKEVEIAEEQQHDNSARIAL